jgi:hypothetical protein
VVLLYIEMGLDSFGGSGRQTPLSKAVVLDYVDRMISR